MKIKRKSYGLLVLKRGIVDRGPKWRQPLAHRDEVLCYINLPSWVAVTHRGVYHHIFHKLVPYKEFQVYEQSQYAHENITCRSRVINNWNNNSDIWSTKRNNINIKWVRKILVVFIVIVMNSTWRPVIWISSLFYSENGGRNFTRNVANNVPDTMAAYSTR